VNRRRCAGKAHELVVDEGELNHRAGPPALYWFIRRSDVQEVGKMVRRDGKIMLLFILFFALFKWFFD
jgi:hypothetical protein